ncbi:MAG TPA: amidohydrolase family protein [Streptosporangiaceae bacterium]|nr:amidohydrolase family protein [Streptosporangiaceae bacterium]
MDTQGIPPQLQDALDRPLVDHHCHGVLRGAVDRAAFEQLIVEGGLPAPPGTTHFDTPVGLAVRRWCAPLLDLPPHAPASDYLARRAELGPEEVNRRLLGAAGIGVFCVDTGLDASRGTNAPDAIAAPATLLSPGEMGAAGGGAAGREIVRIERVAREVAERAPTAAGYADEFAEELFRRASDAAGLKTIIAYRCGLDFDPWPPEPGEVVAAASTWFTGYHVESRLADPVLLRHALWTALAVAREYGLPIQFHTGYGDTDLRLHRANPVLMTDFLRAAQPVPVVLLHCYPYVREAAYLAAVYPHVYLDCGLAVTYTAAASAAVLAESLELAPFHKNLFSTDCYGLAELCHLGALYFRHGLGALLAERVRAGEWSLPDAARVARLIGGGNARRIYPLDP